MEKVHGNAHGSKKPQRCFVDSLHVWLNVQRDKMQHGSFNRVVKRRRGASSVLACSSERANWRALRPPTLHTPLDSRGKLLPSQRSQSFVPLPFEPPTADFTGTLHQKETGGLKGFCWGQTKSPLC